MAVAHIAEQSLFSEAYARKAGLLQALDVRIKLLSFLCILVMVSFLRTPQSLWVMYGVSLVLAVMSRVPLGFFLKRVWLFVPLFSAAIVLPALLNIVTPGDPILVVIKLARNYTWGPYTIPAEIAVTRQGLWGAIVFVSRVVASVSFAVLFTLTSKWGDVFSGLRSLFVPRIFVMTLSMTERYLFVFLRLIQDMYRARKSRTIRPFSTAVERRWTASRIGVTFKKSLEMSDDVYKAMLSRGFQGEFRTIDRFHSRPVDYLWLVTVLAVGGILIMAERGVLQ
ncbi:MAG TPA: cobalt ECF transporter T component CbiQ [Nitrospirota bacterium]|nr:cobalt ECF transporter T component CbiQ [Nitrospirota bacterium]